MPNNDTTTSPKNFYKVRIESGNQYSFGFCATKLNSTQKPYHDLDKKVVVLATSLIPKIIEEFSSCAAIDFKEAIEENGGEVEFYCTKEAAAKESFFEIVMFALCQQLFSDRTGQQWAFISKLKKIPK
jgi:exoribonuclease R